MYAFGASHACRHFCFFCLMWIAVCILAFTEAGLGTGSGAEAGCAAADHASCGRWAIHATEGKYASPGKAGIRSGDCPGNPANATNAVGAETQSGTATGAAQAA